MKIIIVASSPVKTFYQNYHLNPSDYFIGIDAGSLELIKRGIKPDLSIGDFDSTEELDYIQEHSYETLVFSRKKNETDLELAFKYLEQLKGSLNLEIDVYDATSARLDHEFNTYMLMAKYDKYKIRIIDDENEVIYMKTNDSYEIKRPHCKYFSLFAKEETVVSITNALYELDQVLLSPNDTYAVSNEPLHNHKNPIIEVKRGGIYLFSFFAKEGIN